MLERSAAGVGLLLVLASLGFLFYEGIWGENSPPDIQVSASEITANGEDWLVAFAAANRGGETASAVRVVGELVQGGTVIERNEVTLDYVPADSEVRGGLYFTNDPQQGELRIRASGYQKP